MPAMAITDCPVRHQLHPAPTIYSLPAFTCAKSHKKRRNFSSSLGGCNILNVKMKPFGRSGCHLRKSGEGQLRILNLRVGLLAKGRLHQNVGSHLCGSRPDNWPRCEALKMKVYGLTDE